MKTASVNVRIQENIKEEAEKNLSQIGFSSDSHWFILSTNFYE